MASDLSSYFFPDRHASPDRKLGRLREYEQEGANFLKQCRAYEDIDKSIDVIAGIDDSTIPESLSNVRTNRLKRQVREVVATLSNLRPLWGYSTDNEAYNQSAEVLNSLVYGWWLATFADRSIRQAMQWACVSTGWISPGWNPDYWRIGRGDITLNVYGPRDVLPIQMGRDMDIQQAYAVSIQQEVPLFQVYKSFPHFSDKLTPDRQSASWFRQRIRKITSPLTSSPIGRIFSEKEETTTSGPTLDVFDTYINDFSINTSGQPVRMGEPGSPWEYEVPYLGQDIEVGMDGLGQKLYRKAVHADCLLYPFRRRIRSTRTAILYDGPSHWWHGKVPLIKFTVDDWPNEFLGYGLVRDCQTLQESLNRKLRGIDDACQVALRPHVLFDPNLIDRGEVKRFDPRVPGRKVPVNSQMGKGIEIVPPSELPPWVLTSVQMDKDEMDYLMAIRDMQNLAKTNQIPSAESIDKILEMAGPVVTDISRGMERSLRDLGEMVKCLFYEFYTTPRKVKVMGAAGLDEKDFTFTPDSMIPETMKSTFYPMEVIPQNLARAKAAMNNCIFHITPNSLHQIQQMSRKLLYLQLWRDGRFPIDPETVAEALDIPNFGTLPGDKSDVLDRWEAWQQKMLETQMKAQMAVAQFQMEMGLGAGAMGAGMIAGQAAAGANGEGGEQGGGQGKPNGQAHEGRPPSGQRAPHIQSKDGGTRSTISES